MDVQGMFLLRTYDVSVLLSDNFALQKYLQCTVTETRLIE